MRIAVNTYGWENRLVGWFLDSLPRCVRARVEERVEAVCSGYEAFGEGSYHGDGRKVTLSRTGLPHPRYFIELLAHKFGEGLRYCEGGEFDLHEYASGFPLLLFHGEAIQRMAREEALFRDVIDFYQTEIFEGQDGSIDLDSLLGSFLLQAEAAMGKSTDSLVKELFRDQKNGYLAKIYDL